jgi:PKD repeat protein
MTSPGALRLIFILLAATLVLSQPVSLSSQTPVPQAAKTAAQDVPQKRKTLADFAKQIQKRPTSFPQLTLTPDTETPVINQNVNFTLTWSQAVQRPSYRFDWGDFQYTDSTQPGSNHPYQAPGSYTVRVTAKALFNDKLTEFHSNDVTINVSLAEPPRALPLPTLTTNPAQSRVGESVAFIAAIDPSVGPAQYHFYFDDGSDKVSETNQVPHTYEHPGTYHPYVSASLGRGDETVTGNPIQFIVDALVVPPPVIRQLTVTLLTQEPKAGKLVAVEASLNPKFEALYEFDWGDRSTPEKAQASGLASHTYSAAGTYTVQVTAWVKGTDTNPITGSVPIVVQADGFLLKLLEAAALLGLLAAGAVIVWRLRQPSKTPATQVPNLEVIGHTDLGSHQISLANHGVVHVSLTLKPGADPSEDRITFL